MPVRRLVASAALLRRSLNQAPNGESWIPYFRLDSLDALARRPSLTPADRKELNGTLAKFDRALSDARYEVVTRLPGFQSTRDNLTRLVNDSAVQQAAGQSQPVDADGHTWLVGQYRYAHGRYEWEVPEGGAPNGEAVLDSAKRALAEETGLSAGRWDPGCASTVPRSRWSCSCRA